MLFAIFSPISSISNKSSTLELIIALMFFNSFVIIFDVFTPTYLIPSANITFSKLLSLDFFIASKIFSADFLPNPSSFSRSSIISSYNSF